MDGSYKQLSLRVSWRLTQGAVVDAHRDHEQDFEEFSEKVIRALRMDGAVGVRVTAGVRNEYRDIRFTAARPIPQADWAEAIGNVCEACCVRSDKQTWAMQ